MAENPTALDFNLGNEQDYMLDRSYAASSRLNFQFYLWKDSLRFHIHPSIPSPAQNACIADVATGVAIWLIDVAKEFPTAQLDGFDIDLTQAPSKQWLPPNITLRTWNIFEDVPVDLLAKYDFVHVRLLVLVVENSDPRPVVRKHVTMLKPGGYLQWDDLNYPDTCVKSFDSSLKTPALQELRTIAYSQGRNDWTLQLDSIMSEEGLKDATLYHFHDKLELAKANSDQHLLTLEEFASRLEKAGMNDESARLFGLLQRAYKGSLDGAAFSMLRIVSVARKT